MDKYEKILTLIKELVTEINALSKTEFKKLQLGLELSIWMDRANKLETKEAKSK